MDTSHTNFTDKVRPDGMVIEHGRSVRLDDLLSHLDAMAIGDPFVTVDQVAAGTAADFIRELIAGLDDGSVDGHTDVFVR